MSGLPSGWALTSIESLCEVAFDGPFGSNLKSADYTESGVRVVRLENIGHLEFREALRTYISRSKYFELEKHTLFANDIVFSSFVDEAVRVCLIPKELGIAINKADCFCLRIDRAVALPGFVAYRLASNETYADFSAMVRGVTRPRVNISHLKGYEIGVPPLAEQRRVVEKLDSLTARVNSCQARLDRVPQILKRFREAVLEAAVSGKLTEAWRDSRSPDDTNDDLANWVPMELKEFVSEINQGWSPKCEQGSSTDESDWAVIKTTAVQAMNFDGTHNKRLPASLVPREDLEVKVGDILITRAGPRVRAGVACLVTQTRRRLLVCDKVYRFRPRSETVLGEFVVVLLNSPSAVQALDRMKTGISDSGVNITQQGFLAMEFLLPSLPEQREIVRRVGEVFACAENLERRYADACRRVEAVMPSLLAKAFRGELVPQDPSDEPASVLLERIRKGREAEPAGKKTGKRAAAAIVKAEAGKTDAKERIRRSKVAARSTTQPTRRTRSR